MYPMTSGLLKKETIQDLYTSRPNMKILLFVLEVYVGHLGWASGYMGIEGNANAIYDFP